MRKFSSYAMITLKGIGMGAADVIPGVSGGTIAFLTGIYEELLGSIKSINTQAFKLLFTGKLGQFWKHINGNFLISLILGIGISFFSLAKLMQYLMANEPIPLWSFFFGLIIASAILILKDIDLTKIKHLLALALGTAAGAAICLISPTETPNDLWFIFLCGAIAICAMILPGISGSFILLLLGKYEYMLKALTDLNIVLIITFVIGAAIGIVSFSHFLTWLLKKYRIGTLSVLAGFIIGSLIKVWPWFIDNSEYDANGIFAWGSFTPLLPDKFADIGKFEDCRKPLINLPARHTENRSVQVNILHAGIFRIESAAQFQKRGDPAFFLDGPACGHQGSGDDLEQGAFPRAVPADDTDAFSAFHLKIDVPQSPELLVELPMPHAQRLKQPVHGFRIHLETF